MIEVRVFKIEIVVCIGRFCMLCSLFVLIYIYIYICVCVCVCVCNGFYLPLCGSLLTASFMYFLKRNAIIRGDSGKSRLIIVFLF